MQSTETPNKTPNSLAVWGTRIAALILWLITILLGMLEILFISRISMRIYASFANDIRMTHVIGDVAAVVAAVLYVVFVVGSTEYHIKHVGQTGSWTLFGWTFAIELLILILYFVV